LGGSGGRFPGGKFDVQKQQEKPRVDDLLEFVYGWRNFCSTRAHQLGEVLGDPCAASSIWLSALQPLNIKQTYVLEMKNEFYNHQSPNT
jgi:hypothetical protein